MKTNAERNPILLIILPVRSFAHFARESSVRIYFFYQVNALGEPQFPFRRMILKLLYKKTKQKQVVQFLTFLKRFLCANFTSIFNKIIMPL